MSVMAARWEICNALGDTPLVCYDCGSPRLESGGALMTAGDSLCDYCLRPVCNACFSMRHNALSAFAQHGVCGRPTP